MSDQPEQVRLVELLRIPRNVRVGYDTDHYGNTHYHSVPIGQYANAAADRITELENTNRLLCRDLDEAQRTIEVLRGESIE